MTFSQTISKKELSDSVRCLNNQQLQIINGVFIDLDDCEKENISLNKIITVQDTLLKSKLEIQEWYKRQNEFNEDLKYQLTASINTQIQRFNVLESEYKRQAKQQKKRSLITGTTIGLGLTITLAIIAYQIAK